MVCARIPFQTSEAMQRLEQHRVAQREQHERDQKLQRIADFSKTVGRRYASCNLENFSATLNEQKEVLRSVVEYSENLKQRVERGANILLFGPSGTGKDHLLVALGKLAAEQGFTIRWANGQDLIGDFRALIDSDETERHFIESYSNPQIVVISDPLPPSGPLTDFQAGMLFRLVDARYRDCRPTWVSINVANRAEAQQRMGTAIVDRLTDIAVVRFCNWPSHRKPIEPSI